MAINGLGTTSGYGFVTQSTLTATVGLVPAVPTSIANSGGSASLTGNTVSFTGCSSVSLNGCFTGDYDNYHLFVTLDALVNNDTLFMRLRASGTDNASSYRTENIQNYGSTVQAAQNPNGDGTKFTLIGNVGSANAGSIATDVILTRPGAAKKTVGFHRAFGLTPTATAVGWTSSYWHDVATAYDGFSCFTSSGGGMTGTVSVYGFKK